MLSATGAMLYMKQDLAAQIAGKLTQTEGVEYEVVKETKGFRVKPKIAPIQKLQKAVQKLQETKVPFVEAKQELADALAGVKAQFTDTGVSPNNVIEPAPMGDAYQVSAHYEKETPTMIFTVIDGVKRVFGKSDLIGWEVSKSEPLVVLRMTADKAKKWKLMPKKA